LADALQCAFGSVFTYSGQHPYADAEGERSMPDPTRADAQSNSRTSNAETSGEAEAFSLESRAKSFGHAFSGISFVARSQHNAWIHLVATICVVGLGVLLPLSRLDWCALIIAIAMVWAAEAINTAIELLGDATSAGHNPLVGRAKDAGAGAVLITAIAAAAVGVLILGPPLFAMLGLSD